MNKLRISISLMILSGATACSSLTYKNDAEKTAKVKRIAVVAIASLQPQTSGEKILAAFTHSDEMHAANCTEAAYVKPMKTLIENTFQEQLGFQVVREVEQNPYYQTVEKRLEGGGFMAMIPSGSACYTAKGVIDAYRWMRLSGDEISGLIRALKVDAIVTVNAETLEDATTVMGVAVGGAKESVRLSARMYNGVDEKPIWYDTNAKGDEVKEGTTSVLGFADRDVLNQKALIGTKSAALNLTKRFRTQE